VSLLLLGSYLFIYFTFANIDNKNIVRTSEHGTAVQPGNMTALTARAPYSNEARSKSNENNVNKNAGYIFS